MSSILFEVSWEVCNKVGGIHTVISSKVEQAKINFKNYYCVGNYLHAQKEYFEEKETPLEYKNTSAVLEKLGIKVYFGIWKIRGEPNCLLIDYSNFTHNTPKIKGELWKKFKIDSLNSFWHDFDETIVWSWACGIAIDYLTKNKNEDVLLHVHEWMAGGALFYNKLNKNKKIKTIFTTHATMLGRAICGNNMNLYDLEKNIDPQEFAYKLNIQTKHQCERALAHNADCFSTVSDITAYEAELFYSKKPDVLLYNGFLSTEFDYNFQRAREKMNEFLEAYFYLSYDIDTTKTQVIFTSGRNEVRNKGVDVLISSLAKLNEKLKKGNSEKTIVCFVLLLVGEFKEEIFIRESFTEYEKKSPKFKQMRAPLSTHQIPTDNPMIRQLFEQGLQNRENDRVKVILCPKYLDSKDGFFNRDYYEITSACDLSVFVSFYEPWGYTPLESISCSVPTITSDLSGFGKYLQERALKNCFLIDGKKSCSVEVLNRAGKNDTEVTESLFLLLDNFTKKNAEELYFDREVSKELSKQFDWKEFYKNYLKAYEFALRKDL